MKNSINWARIKRRIISISIMLVLILEIVPGTTLAFYTTSSIATNVITAGNIEIDLIEEAEDESGGRVPFENVADAAPGDTFSKIPMVVNTGDYTAWIRVSSDVSVTLADGVTTEAGFKYAEIDYDTTNWEYRDGYWYYLKPLEAGATTAPLFTKVAFDLGITNDYGDCTVSVKLVAYAVQHVHNADGEGQTVFDALGWPEGGNG